MFSSTLKRPATTLAVVAGLLAAAGPASALAVGVRENGSQGAVKATPQGTVTNGTADDHVSVIPWLWDNQTNVTFDPGIGDDLFDDVVARPRAHGSDIKPWQTTHQGGSASFMR